MKPRIENILFPFDFSPQCDVVAPYISALANRCDAVITMLSVVPTARDVPSPDLPLSGIDMPEAELALHLRNAAAQRFPGIEVECKTAIGEPAIQIYEYAHAAETDLIMMPTHGFGTFREMLIGSVTAKVLHDVACPVWTAAHALSQAAPVEPRVILCAVDRLHRTDRIVPVLKWAAGFSRRMGAELRLLNVTPHFSKSLQLENLEEIEREIAREAETQLLELCAQAQLDCPVATAFGETAQTISAQATEQGADLVLVGRGSVRETLGPLHTHLFAIVQESPCPVLSV